MAVAEVGRCRLTLSRPVLRAHTASVTLTVCDEVLSNVAFKFNLRRYTEELKLPLLADEAYAGMTFGKRFVPLAEVAEGVPVFSAGANTRPLLSSTSAVSDTQNIPLAPKHLLHPRHKYLLNSPYTPHFHKKR